MVRWQNHNPDVKLDMELQHIQIACPACWQNCELEIDPTLGDQDFIEDCWVCCRPMKVQVTVWDGEVQVDVSDGNE